MDEIEEIEQVGKPITNSKTVHFNVVSSVVIHAVWPILPATFREKPYAMSAVMAWYSIGNIVLRFFTREALSIAAWRYRAKQKDETRKS